MHFNEIGKFINGEADKAEENEKLNELDEITLIIISETRNIYMYRKFDMINVTSYKCYSLSWSTL